MLRRVSAFTTAAVLLLGLGIGISLPVFGLVEAGLFREVAYANPPGILGLETHGGISGWSDRARTPVELQAQRLDTLLKTLAVLGGFVLAIGCVNLASLLLSRGAERRRALVIRAAVGARATQLAGGLLKDVLVPACLGVAAGLAIGFFGIAALQATWPESLPAWLATGPPPASVVVGIGIPVAVVLGFGISPIVTFWRKDLRSALTAGHGVTAGLLESLVRRALLFLSIAATALLLANMLLLLRAASADTATRAAGAAGAETLAMTIALPAGGPTAAAERLGLYDALLDRLRAVPGVQATSIASPGTWVGQGVFDNDMVDCGACSIGGAYVPIFPENVRHHVVGPSYFDTVGVSLVSGREFTEADRLAAPRVAIVNQAFAMRSFERGRPIGRGVQLHGPAGEWYTVVGIVPNTDPPGIGVGDEPVPTMYLSALQHPPQVADLAVRTSGGDPLDLAPLVAAAAGEIVPGIDMSDPSTLADRLEQFVAPLRWFSRVLAGIGAAAVVFSTVALYNVMAFTVGSRRREIGVRMAVGARAGQVTTMILAQAFRLTLLASLIGLTFAIGVARMLQQEFMGVRPLDAGVYAAVAALLVSVSLVAAFVPARRAARVDPAIAFRAE